MLLPIPDITTQLLRDELFEKKGVAVSVLRLDGLHPVISGNKLFKLHYFLQKATQQSLDGVITFGGAWSNHLVATAYACREAGLKCTGIVRGEQPASPSATLLACAGYGMEINFISREEYANKEDPAFLNAVLLSYKNYLVVPEGGYDPLGAAGAELVMDLIAADTSHICCAVGTATTLAGLLMGAKKGQQLIAVPALKNMHDLQQRIEFLTKRSFDIKQLKIMDTYHFGGYAKKTSELIGFMNGLYVKHQLPTDFVYTGKMMFGILDLVGKDFFPAGSNILCVHTGGLQGNLSLPLNTLVF